MVRGESERPAKPEVGFCLAAAHVGNPWIQTHETF